MTQVDPRRFSHGAFPAITQAYQNDPRTKLAASLIQSGGNTAPVAGGGWAWADGLSRIASALGGGLVQKSQDKKYGEQEQQYMDALKASAPSVDYAAPTPQPQPSPASMPANPVQGTMAQAAQALGGDPRSMPQPMQTIDPTADLAATSPAGGPSGANPPPYGGGPALRPMNAQNAPFSAPPMASGASRTDTQGPDLNRMFMQGIVGQEGVQNNDGTWQTSWKGAVGPAQVMPSTGPEAARLAGLKWDRKLFRDKGEAGAAYNLKLGQAYFAHQLETFGGDPLKAAAAYNAGAGAVRRAMRRANANGGEWVDYLPSTTKDGKVVDTTKAYVERFSRNMGGTGGSGGVAPPGQQVQAAPLEPVPDAPQVPQQRPDAPAVPDEVKSSYMQMAQRMIQSDNPFAVAMGQAYLEKGMDEQFTARRDTNQQQFQRDNMGYETDLNDYADARSAGRTNAYQERRDAINTNRNRVDTAQQQQWQSNEADLDRQFRSTQADMDREIQREGLELDRQRLVQTAKAAGVKNPFLDTASGIKMYEEMTDENQKLDGSIGKLDRYLSLLERQGTGGIYGAPFGAGEIFTGIMGANDPEIDEMVSIGNDAALQELGGSLGVAISDGDRAFVQKMAPDMASSTTANRNKATILRAALNRKRDFNSAKIYAMSEGGMALPQFERMWRAYADANPIVNYENGDAVYSNNDRTFDQWLESIPQYDAAGNKVN